MFPLFSHYLSAVEDRITQEVIPNVDACKRWVETTGDVGGDVEMARAARSLRWRLDQLCGRLDALQHAARVIDRHGGPEQECGSSATATTTNDLSHTSAFRSGIPGHASQPTHSTVASLAANGAGDFARLTDGSYYCSSNDVAMHREIATTDQQSFQGPDCSTMQRNPCYEGVNQCDPILPSPLSESVAFLFPHNSIPDIGVACTEASLGAAEGSLTAHPLNGLENELPISTRKNKPYESVPNSIQPSEIENPTLLATKNASSVPAETQAAIGNSRCARQQTSNCNMLAGANGAGSGHDFGVMKIQSTALGARCSGRTPIQIDSGSESEPNSEGSVSVDQEMTLPGVDPHLLRLVDKANASWNLPTGTLRRFLPGRWLNDMNITETVRMLVPETAEPLIAQYAIENFPEGGIAQLCTPNDVQSTSLRHRKDSTHLIIAYNVPNGNLNCTKHDNMNHWVLVIVNVLTREIHIFGVEAGLEGQAEALARNIGMFVDNHRSRFDDYLSSLNWSKPILEPLYPLGITPDTHNCGIAVISRTEAFFHPKRALNVHTKTTPFELAQQLDQKRVEYLRLYTDIYKSVHTTKKLYDQITQPTITPAKRLALDHPCKIRPEKVAKRSPQWLLSYPTPLLSSEPRLSKPDLWKKCIMTCADANGFNAEGLFQAVHNAPECALEDVARVLQLFCEVANPERLIMLKRLLNQGPAEPFLREATSTSSDTETLWQLHCLINKFAAVDIPILIFKSLFCLLCYYECHEFTVSSRRKELEFGRANHKRERDRERGRNRPQAPSKQDLSRPALTAEQQIRASLVERSQKAGVSLKEAREQIKKNLQYGKRLKLLLNGRNPLWLFLMLIQADGSSILRGDKTPPALNLRDFTPPTECRKLSEPIPTDELLDLTEKLATWFGQYLFIARPELRDIDLSYIDIFGNIPSPIRLCATPDEEIYGTAPKDIGKLFH